MCVCVCVCVCDPCRVEYVHVYLSVCVCVSESSKERYSASPATDGFAAKVAMQCTDVDQTHAECQTP